MYNIALAILTFVYLINTIQNLFFLKKKKNYTFIKLRTIIQYIKKERLFRVFSIFVKRMQKDEAIYRF